MKRTISTLVAVLVLTASGAMAMGETTNEEFNPFEEMRKMQKEMDDVFERFHQKMMKEDTFRKYTFTFPSMPAMDLVDKGNDYILNMDIPGAEKNKIDIRMEGRVLKVEAETSKDKKEEGKGYLKQERFTSSYMRMITLPQDANAKKFKSEYEDGVLKITIPKKKK